ncbi:hypothetical protein A0H81_05169 [Grifola frondosa]|uniref:BAR-domain-containing protein n=1 Tax=Grifola frondosa TaxID=5627 RepID=A0A1C7MD82_GRIFR|nr:hypothetical protein A0H81_05169 [Grifola frondosa]
MTSKQLGKLRQWAGEVISSRDKTVVTDEFRELEHDVELRRQGLWRLHVASEDYQHYLCKKKESEVLGEAEKVLLADALGTVMIKHGEDFGEDSAYGVCLVNLGRAHCKIATLQESFAMALGDTYVASLRQGEDEIKEYHAQRKKLESRRLSYDAAFSKLERSKANKKEKEKDRKEAEEECLKAKSRYDETAEDVRARMYAIQENEVQQLRDLTAFLDLEISYVQEYMEVLLGVKAGWVDESVVKRMELSRTQGPTHSFARQGSVRSNKSSSKRSTHESSDEESADDESISRTKSRRKSDSKPPSRPPSRPQSRASRKRSDSAVSEKDKAEKVSKRKSMAGWASSAVSSVTGRGKKDRDKFAALHDDASDGDKEAEEFGETKRPSSALSSSHLSKQHKTRGSISAPGSSSNLSSRILKSSEPQKRVVALHDFAAASSDELSFKAGDQIVVVSEVLNGWWMGELAGKRGLFPTTYTEVISSSASLSVKPPLPKRPPASFTRGLDLNSTSSSSLEDASSRNALGGSDTSHSGTRDPDDEHPFGDHYVAGGSSALDGRFYPDSSSADEDNDEEHLMPAQQTPASESDGQWFGHVTCEESSTTTPPRRSTLTATPTNLMRLPALHSSKSSQSSSASFATLATTTITTGREADELTYSPFDSPKDESIPMDCHNFKQHPFKATGMCNAQDFTRVEPPFSLKLHTNLTHSLDMSDGPSRKRPRVDDSVVNNGEVNRDEVIWFDDGNIILIAGDTSFRVYKGLLAQRSEIFSDLFTVPQPLDAEEIDGCPVVRLSDSPQDLKYFLQIIFNHSTFFQLGKRIDFAAVSAIIRLGHKYSTSAKSPLAYQRM